MNTVVKNVAVSPVNMEDRKALGLKPGDTVRVHQKIQDKGKTRIQVFDGIVLARKHGDEPGATFTVRKVASGVGMEKIFPLYSPLIDKIEIVKRAKVRRAKLYYIREKVARQIKRQMRRMKLVSLATESEAEALARQAEEEAKAAAAAEAQAEAEATKAAEAQAEATKAAEAQAAPESAEQTDATDTSETPADTPEAPVDTDAETDTQAAEVSDETPEAAPHDDTPAAEPTTEAETPEEPKKD